MKKTLTAIALCATFLTVATAANANLHVRDNEGLQNYYAYFGANCCRNVLSGGPVAAPCAAPAPVCNTCAPQIIRREMETVCRPCPCDPCGGSGFSILNPFSYFG